MTISGPLASPPPTNDNQAATTLSQTETPASNTNGNAESPSQSQPQTQSPPKASTTISTPTFGQQLTPPTSSVPLPTPAGPYGSNISTSASTSASAQAPATQTTGTTTVNTTTAAATDPTNHNIVPRVTNVVVTADLDCPSIDLKYIALRVRGAEYNPMRFQAVTLRVHEPRTTALIFSSGKLVVMGSKNEDDARLACRQYARIIQKLGFPSRLKDFAIQNVVGSAGVSFPIRLEGLAQAHGHFAQYEPEIFPGVIYRMMEPKATLLIFVSGRIVITGAKTRSQMYTAFNKIYPTLLEHKKQ